MSSEVFRLPDLGEGLPEAELVQWLVEEGDDVALNQTIAEVETAKAIVELPSPFAGRVATLHAVAGDVIAVGSPLIAIETRSAAPAGGPEAAEASRAAQDDSEAAPLPNLVGYGAATPNTDRPRRRARGVAVGRATGATAVLDPALDALRVAAPHDALRDDESASRESSMDRVRERPRSTPPVRALARRLGVELALVDASGASAIITREDVEAYAARVAAVDGSPRSVEHDTEHADVPTGDRTTRTPIRGVRKHTAEAMVRSAFTAPHVTTFLTVDVTTTMELVASLKTDAALQGHRVGILAVAAKAACLALMRHPSLNSRWDDAAGEIVEHHYVNLGIAAATGRGLVVPNITDAHEMTLAELADAIAALAETARAGRTTPAAMTGGTFSITNVGVFGVDAGTPILNPGEAGILALGAVRRQPWEHRGEIALRNVMTLALSFDHRLVDGEQGSKFLAEVGGVLREPGRAMLLR